MEPTSNFMRALEFAHNRRSEMPSYSGLPGDLTTQQFAVKQMLRHPFQVIDGRTVNTVAQAHRAVRRLYIRKTWRIGALFFDIDWTKIVDWLTENWDEILKILLTILPLFIL